MGCLSSSLSRSQLTVSPCGFLQMCIHTSSRQPANPEEMHCLFIVPYPHHVAMVYSSGPKQQRPRGNVQMDQ